MEQIHLLLLYGGRSVEHDISIRSATNVFNYLDKQKYNVIPVGITKSGQWFLHGSINSQIENGEPVTVDLNSDIPALKVESKSIPFDVVFPVLHGTDGEDGSIQGLFTLIGAPVVGSDVLGSSCSMNKLVSKQLLTAAKIPNTRFLSYDFSEFSNISFEEVNTQLGMPVIVKPVNLGSSVGVSKASDKASFESAIAETFKYDNEVLIEEFIEGREFEIAVLGNEEPRATVPGEVIVSDEYEFYDFEAKYVDADGASTEIPANMPPQLIEEVKSETIKAYKALFCCDYARVDFFLDGANNIYINEINTIPGFTNISMFPKLWEYEGIGNSALIDKLIQLCLDRYNSKNRITTNFDSELN